MVGPPMSLNLILSPPPSLNFVAPVSETVLLTSGVTDVGCGSSNT